ncbi:MAG: SulP family inorganic anion transporter, partial [Pseudanabaena sp.]
IGFSQVKHLLGLKIPSTESFIELLTLIFSKITEVNWVTLSLGLVSIAILLYCNQPLVKLLKQQGWNEQRILPISKSAPLLVVILGTLLVATFRWDQGAGVKIVGMVPLGLPPLTI